jgi:PleD family two-component response regulator
MALLPRTVVNEAMQFAEELRSGLQDLDLGLGSLEVRITGSFGVAEMYKGETWDGLCSRCDRALYVVKGEGGNAVHGSSFAEPATVEEIFALPEASA